MYLENFFIGVQTLKFKRDELFRSMNLEEIEKSQITEEIQKLNERLSAITASLKLKSEAMNEYDRAIQESEMEFSKVRFLFFKIFCVFLPRKCNIILLNHL